MDYVPNCARWTVSFTRSLLRSPNATPRRSCNNCKDTLSGQQRIVIVHYAEFDYFICFPLFSTELYSLCRDQKLLRKTIFPLNQSRQNDLGPNEGGAGHPRTFEDRVDQRAERLGKVRQSSLQTQSRSHGSHFLACHHRCPSAGHGKFIRVSWARVYCACVRLNYGPGEN